jgi:hypothetical protein
MVLWFGPDSACALAQRSVCVHGSMLMLECSASAESDLRNTLMRVCVGFHVQVCGVANAQLHMLLVRQS